MIITVVFFSAAFGAVCRYLFTENINVLKIDYKIGATFLINIIGSFILGITFKHFALNPIIYALLGTGFCGGFTTFSTFNSELLGLLFDKKYNWMLAYVIGSYVIGMIAGIVGFVI